MRNLYLFQSNPYKLIKLISTITFILFLQNQLYSQCYSPALPISPSGYQSVDPPTFRFNHPYGPSCGIVDMATNSICPITFQNIGMIFFGVGPSDTCVLLPNGIWNSAFGLNNTQCWAMHTMGWGVTWYNGGNITRLPATLPIVSLMLPSNGAVNISTTPLMDWNTIDSANSYKLRIYTEACCINIIYDSTTSLDFLQIPLERLLSYTTYYWKVKPYKTGGEGPFADPYYFTTGLGPPHHPTLISPPNSSIINTTTPTLDWDNVPTATSYQVQVAQDSLFNNLRYDVSGLTSSIVTIPLGTLLFDITYYWRVRAFNSQGSGNWSSVWKFRCISIQSAHQQWVQRYNGPVNGGDQSTSIAVDGFGNVYVTGYSVSSSSGYDYLTVKYNSAGVQQWVQRYNGPANGDDKAYAIAVDSAGNIYITGYVHTDNYYIEEFDFVTIKYNSEGVQQWVQTHRGYCNSGPPFLYSASMALDESGNVYVCGAWNSRMMCGNNYATIKYNSAGVQQWAQTSWPGIGCLDDCAYAITIDNSGNVYVTGYTQYSGFSCYATLKYDFEGNIQWVRIFERQPYVFHLAYSIGLDAACNVYITGVSFDNLNINFDYTTIKYNSEGTQQWVQYDSLGEAYSIAVDSSGNSYVTGSGGTIKYNTNGIQQWVQNFNGALTSITLDGDNNSYVTGTSNSDFATIKYNTSGVQQWVQNYNGPGNGNDQANSIAVDRSGNVYVTGFSGGSGTGSDYATIKYNQILFPPNLISPPNGSTGQSITPLLEWDSLVSAIYYQVQVSKTSEFTVNVIDTSALVNSTLQILPGKLLYDSLYYWKVRGFNIMGFGSWSGVWNFRVTCNPPVPNQEAPPNGATGLTLTPTLDWSDVIQATKYRIQVSQQLNFNNTLIDDSSITLSQYTISPGYLSIGTKYYWRVAASNDTNWSHFSGIWNFTTRGMPLQVLLSSPQNNSTFQPTTLTFSWFKATETLQKSAILFESEKPEEEKTDFINTFSKEKINYDAIGNYWFELTTDTVTFAGLVRDTLLTDTTKVLSTLNYAVTYYWRVKAKGDLGWGQFSSWWKFTTKTGIPLQVVLSNPPNNSTKQPLELIFNWYKAVETLLQPFEQKPLIDKSQRSEIKKIQSAIDAINSYWFELTIDTVTLAGLLRDTLLTDTIKVMNTLNYAVTYYWRVKAKGDLGWGPFSEWWKFTTKTGIPLQVVLNNPPNNATNQHLDLTFNWYKAEETLLNPVEQKPLWDKSQRSDIKKFQSGIDAINSYWFEITTDTITLAGLVRDTLLSDTTKVLSGLNYAVTYYWRVKAKGDSTWGPFSDWWNFTTIDGLPEKVVLFSPENNSIELPSSLTFIWYTPLEILLKPYLRKDSDNSILLNTKNNIDAISAYWFELTTDTVTLAGLVRDTTITDTTKALSGLSYFTTFYWRVKAKNQNGWGTFSDWWQFTTTDGLPKQVVLFSPENYSVDQTTSLTFTWYTPLEILLKSKLQKNINSDTIKNYTDVISTYWFELTTDPETFADLIRDTTITDTAKTLTGLNYNTTFYWRVKAKNENGWGTFSEWWLFTTTDGLPEQVVLFSPENYSYDLSTSLTFTWYTPLEILLKPQLQNDIKRNTEKNNKDAISTYWFELTTDPENFTDLIRDTTLIDTTKDVSGLRGATTYYWRVKAKNELGWGIFSDWWEFTTFLIITPELYSPENTAADISIIPYFDWSDAEGAENYSLQVSTNTTFINPVLDSNDITVSEHYTMCGLLKYDTLYYWRVRSNNVIGNSPWSETWSFTVQAKPEWYLQCTGWQSSLLDIFFINVNTGWACGYDGIIKTTTGGSTWFPVNNGISFNCFSIFFIDANTGWVADDYDLIYKTTNGGVLWNYGSVSGANGIKSFEFINANTGYFAINSGYYFKITGKPHQSRFGFDYDQGLFKTTNGGINWFYLNVPVTTNYNAVSFPSSGLIGYTSGGHGEASGTGYLFKTTNAGVNWIEQYVTGSSQLMDLSFIDQLTGWAVGLGSTVLYTSNGGTNWAFRNNSIEADLFSVQFINESTGWTCGGSNIYKTTNAGVNWTLTPNIFPGLTSITFNSAKGWISGENGVVLKNDSEEEIPLPILISPLNGATGVSLTPALDWSSIPGATKYRVQVSTDSNFSTTVIDDTSLTNSQYLIPSSILSGYNLYYWRVKAKASSSWSSFTNAWNFRTLGTPTQVFLNNPPNNSTNQLLDLTFNWYKADEMLLKPIGQKLLMDKSERSNIINIQDGLDAISKYWFELTTDTVSFAGLIKDTTLTDTTKTVNGLSDSTIYFWRVKANNEIGWGAFCTWWKFTTIKLPHIPNPVYPPNGATGLSATPLLDWDSIYNANTYQLLIATDSVSRAAVLDTSGLIISSFTVPSGILSPGSLYYWKVRGHNAGGAGAWSYYWHFTVAPVPYTPVLILPPNGSINQSPTPLLDWDSVTVANTYHVQLSRDTVFTVNIIDTSGLVNSNMIVRPGKLSPDSIYYWRVRGFNIIGYGSWSTIWNFRIMPIPSAPNLVAPLNGAQNQSLTPILDWDSIIIASSYQVQLSKNSGFSVIVLDSSGNINSGMIVRSGILQNDSAYYWRVRGNNISGQGLWSQVWNFRVITIPPSPTVLFSPSNNAVGVIPPVNLIWYKTINTINYQVQLSVDSNFSSFIINDSTLTDSVKSATGLSPLITYYWRVRGKNAAGNGNFSPFWRFKILGTPSQVNLVSPPNNSINQPININFLWRKAIDQMALSKSKSNNSLTKDGKLIQFPTSYDDIVNRYWFQLTTDTVSYTNLQQDSTLIDTIKSVAGLNYVNTYYWRVKARNEMGWGIYSTWFKFSTMPLPPAIVVLKIIPGGFYNNVAQSLNMKDTISAFLIDSATCTPKDSTKGVLDSLTFTVPISFSNAQSGMYYLYIYHRNHIPVASRFTQNVVRNSTVSYDFSTDSGKAFGFNMIKLPSFPVKWGMIPGDANRDGFVDGLDQTIWLLQNGLDGYLHADFNGDRFVDGLDQTLWLLYNGQSYFVPCELTFEKPVDHTKKIKSINNKQIEDIFLPEKRKK